jgi:hypothetical protein
MFLYGVFRNALPHFPSEFFGPAHFSFNGSLISKDANSFINTRKIEIFFLYILQKKVGMKRNNDTLVILQYRRI